MAFSKEEYLKLRQERLGETQNPIEGFDTQKFLQFRQARVAATPKGIETFDGQQYLKLREQRIQNEQKMSGSEKITAGVQRLRGQNAVQQETQMEYAARLTNELATQKEAEYEMYLDSEDYEKDTAFFDEAFTIGNWYKEYQAGGVPYDEHKMEVYNRFQSEYGGDIEQVRNSINKRQNDAEEARSQAVMLKDLAEFERWPEEDKNDMMLYLNYTARGTQAMGAAALLSGATAALDRLNDKYGREIVRNIMESCTRRLNAEDIAEAQKSGQENASLLDSVLSVPLGIIGNAADASTKAGQILEDVTGVSSGRYSGIDPNAGGGAMISAYTEAVRQGETENVTAWAQAAAEAQGASKQTQETIGKVAGTVYTAGMGALDNIARIYMTGGVGSLALAGMASFSSSVRESTQNGASAEQAFAMGMVSAASEVLTEKLPLDNLLGVLSKAGSSQSFKAILSNSLKQAGVEVATEELNFLAGLAGEAIILQEKSGYNTMINQLVAQGVAYDEAVSRANKTLVEEAGQTALQSGLSGFMTSAGTGIATKMGTSAFTDAAAQYTQDKQAIENAVEQGPQKQPPGLKLPTVEEGAQSNTEIMSDEEFQERYGLKLRAVDDLQNSSSVSQNVLQQARRLSSALGREIEVYSKDAGENGIENGYYKDGKIYVNEKGADPVAQTVSHELTHSVEAADVYGELSHLVLQKMKASGTDLTQLRQQIKERYARNGVELTNEIEVDKEIVADYVSKNLLTNEQEIVALAKEQPSLGRRMLNWLDGLLAKLGNKDAQERAFLNRARELYVKALRQTQGSSAENAQEMAQVSREAKGLKSVDSEIQETLQWARQQYADGSMTDEEFESFIDSIMEWEEMNNAAEPAEVKHSFFDTDIQKNTANSGVQYSLREIDIDRRFVDYTDIKESNRIITEKVSELTARGKTVPLSGERILNYQQQTDWNDKKTVRQLLGGILSEYLGDSVYFEHEGQVATAYLTREGVNHSLGGPASPRKAAAFDAFFDLVKNSEYAYSSKNDQHSNNNTKIHGRIDWDYFVAAATINGKPYPVVFKIRSIDADVRSQIYEIATKNETGYSHGAGDQENLTDGQPNYGATPISDDTVPQEQSDVKQQYSISDAAVRKQDIISDLRSILDRGGSVAELREYINQMERGERSTKQKNMTAPKSVKRETQNGAQGIIRSAKQQGISVDEFLRQNWEQYDVDGEWNADAQKALDMERAGRQYSIAEESTTEQEEEKAPIDRASLPAKAKDYLKRAERTLLNSIAKKLCVPYYAKRQYLQKIVEDISSEYLKNGIISEETAERLFNKAYEQGVVVDTEFYDQYKDVKEHLRTTAITISDTDKTDIADFGEFRKKAFGIMRIVNEGGIPVDSYYRELQEMAQELFPDYITHPADQLQRMYDVARSIQRVEKTLKEYYGKDADAFKRWAKMDFHSAIEDAVEELHTVKRYADEQDAKDAPAPVTSAEAMEVYAKLKDARRAYEKVAAKNLLTEHDEAIVGDLLKGKRTLESLDPEEDNVKGITAVYEAKREMEQHTRVISQYKRSLHKNMRDIADRYLETANEWKDKKVGIAYSRETMRRNVQDIVKDAKVAEDVNRTFFEPVAVAEAAATRFKDQYRGRVKELGLSRKVEKGNAVSEAHAVQLLGEAMDNIAMIERSRGRMKNRDGKTLTEWQEVISNLWKESPSLNQEKIKSAVNEFRKFYDDLFIRMNEVRVANGYEPVNYRKGYFPHFQPGESDGILAHFGKALGISTEVVSLPTTINGLTHTFKPGIQRFGNAQERLGFNTAYDAIGGFDKYIEGVASVIYQTENIQRLRALASQTRYRTSDDGIREQVDKVYANDELTEDEKQSRVAEIYSKGRFTLSNFVVELDEYTNLLANKKSKLDRTVEGMLGRRFYTFMKWWEGRVGANMIAGNLSSALTNFIPLTQAGAQLDRGMLLSGMWNTLRSIKQSDTLLSRSDFITNRRGSDPLVKTWVQKASGVAGKPMELIDGFVSESIVRAAYYQNLKHGLSESEAMHQADIFAAGVMADRSKGAMPTLFESHNPLFKAFTQFQLEVNNQFSEVFKDLPRGFREKSLAALAGVLLKYFLGAFLFNDLYEWLFGRRPALDPFGILNETVGDFTGYELPNLLDLGIGVITGDMPSFETEQVGAGEAVKKLGGNVLDEMPFASGLTLFGVETDGGRIPASSAVPDFSALIDAAAKTEWSAEKRWKEAKGELAKPLTYSALPFGGNQIAKTWKGLEAYFKGGSYTVDNEGNDILQYPVYKDSAKDAVGNALRAGIMGKSSLREAQDWVNSGFDSLSAKQTAAYQDMLEAKVTDRAAYGLLMDLQRAEKTDEQSRAEIQREIIRRSGIPNEGKAIAYYGIVASENERKLMDKLADLGADSGEAGKVVMDLRDASDLRGQEKKQTQVDVLLKSALTDKEKAAVIESFLGSELVNENGNPTQYAKFLSAMDAGLDVEKYLSIYAASADMDSFFEVADGGVNPNDAADIIATVTDQLRKETKEDMAALEKWRICVNLFGSSTDQLAALSMVMTPAQLEKAEMANKYGVNPKSYVDFYEIRKSYDADGNGSYTQTEIKAAIDSMGNRCTTEQKAVLWQLATGAKSAKNNPYSSATGQKIIDAKQAAKDAEAELPKLILGGT